MTHQPFANLNEFSIFAKVEKKLLKVQFEKDLFGVNLDNILHLFFNGSPR